MKRHRPREFNKDRHEPIKIYKNEKLNKTNNIFFKILKHSKNQDE